MLAKSISEYCSIASKLLFSWHVLIVTGLLCFGYVAHLIWGANNAVEKVDEEILKDVFGVDVEFSK
jgi:hypothetical protein